MRVVVVGGGLVGMFSAYYLAKSGHEVSLIDPGRRDVRTSVYNAGLISPSFSPLPVSGLTDLIVLSAGGHEAVRVSKRLILSSPRWFYSLVKSVGRTDPRPLLELGEASLRLYEEFFRKEGVDVDLARGVVGLYYNRSEAENTAELMGGRFIDETECRELGFDNVAAGVLFPRDLSINPAKLYSALRSLLVREGVVLVPGEAVLTRSGDEASVSVKGDRVGSDYVVLSAGAWTTKACKRLGYNPMILPARGLVLLFDCGGERLLGRPGFVEDLGVGLVQHDEKTLRATGFFELVGFNPRFGGDEVSWLVKQVGKHVAGGSRVRLVEKGVGFRPCTPDSMPVIGRVPGYRNLIIASGHCRLGVTLAPATGFIVESLVSGRRVEVNTAPFDPGRF